jgi:hypothetical protein
MSISLSQNKYHNRKTEVDGIEFHSAAEARRYGELKLMVRAGVIDDLVTQPRWDLPVNGLIVGRYVGDFSYVQRDTGQLVVEDVKSDPTKTAIYRLKKKLMLAIHGLTIMEVEA